MSDTDDTDELLLIPPDFFTAPQPESPFLDVVDSLITQVNNLEERVSYLQNTSDISLVSNSLDSSSPSSNMYNNNNNFRKFRSTEDLPLYQRMPNSPRTPTKPLNKYTLNSLPASPLDNPSARNRHSPRNYSNSSNVGSFMSTVSTIKKLEAARNLSREFKDFVKDVPKINEDKVNVELEMSLSKEKAWKCVEDLATVPDYGLGVRETMFKTNFNVSESSSSSESTGQTAFNKLEEKTTSQALDTFNKFTKSSDDTPRLDDKNNLQLLSLSKLWRNNQNVEPTKYKEKLQEEKLRREHCEDMIQQLQNKILELQERLAVALKVDEAKDNALKEFKEVWDKMEFKCDKLKDDKKRLEQEVKDLRERYQRDLDNAQQEAKRFEKEVSDAKINIWEWRDKISVLEQRVTELQTEVKTAQANLNEMNTKYMIEVEKNKNYPEIIAQKEVELNECRAILGEARKEVLQSKKAVDICHADLSAMRDENAKLEQKLLKECETVVELNECRKKLINEIDTRKRIQKNLEDQLKEVREQVENNKIELKNFYQGQVELVVSTKLKEFQGQLDQAENALKEEMKKKEMSIAKKAAHHLQQLNEKNNMEVKLLEQRHLEEINFYQVKMNKQQQELDEVKVKLAREKEKSNNFFKQVVKFVDSIKQDENSVTSDKLNTKSYNNLEEIILSMNEDDDNKDKETKERRDTQQRLALETPMSTRNHRKQVKDNELRGLIDVLLDRPPGQPTSENREQASGNEGSGTYKQKDRKYNEKRPWK